MNSDQLGAFRRRQLDTDAFMVFRDFSNQEVMRQLKKYALMFDRIEMPGLRALINYFKESTGYDEEVTNQIATLDWLYEQKLISDTDTYFPTELKKDLTFTRYRDQTRAALAEVSSLSLSHMGRFCYLVEDMATALSLEELSEREAALLARLVSVKLRNTDGLEAVPILPMSSRMGAAPFESGKDAVIDVVLTGFPEPSDSTPWEQIIDYRADPDSRERFLALRVWMSDLAKAELSKSELSQKLEYSLVQYANHMKLHHMKTQLGALETFVTVGAELLESVIKLRFAAASRLLFSFKYRKLALMEAELTAPGKELAYISSVRKKFKP
jgi:hypothetical protein